MQRGRVRDRGILIRTSLLQRNRGRTALSAGSTGLRYCFDSHGRFSLLRGLDWRTGLYGKAHGHQWPELVTGAERATGAGLASEAGCLAVVSP